MCLYVRVFAMIEMFCHIVLLALFVLCCLVDEKCCKVGGVTIVRKQHLENEAKVIKGL